MCYFFLRHGVYVLNVVCRLPTIELQLSRPVPRKPSFLLASLTREGLLTASTDHTLPPRYDFALNIICYDVYSFPLYDEYQCFIIRHRCDS